MDRKENSQLKRLPLKKLLLSALAVIFILWVGSTIYSLMALRSLQEEKKTTPRDSNTGIVLDAEPLSLGPENASAAVLLLHGHVGSRVDFAGLGERLAEEGFRVRYALLAGHGTTPDDYGRQTPETILRAAADELMALRAEYDKVYLVGFSMGGTISTLLASEHNVDRLVLIAPYYRVTYHWYYGLPPSTWNKMLSPIVPYVIKSEGYIQVNKRDSVPSMFSYRTVPTRAVNTLTELGRRARNPKVLEKIDCPLLVLHSHGDEAASPDATAEAFERIASTDKEIAWYTKRSNHHLLWDYDARDVVARILQFLEPPKRDEIAETADK